MKNEVRFLACDRSHIIRPHSNFCWYFSIDQQHILQPYYKSKQYIQYESQLWYMIYLIYLNDISKNDITRHYRKHHKNIHLNIHKNLIKYINNFDLCKANTFESLNMIISCIENLAIQQELRYLHDNYNYAYIESILIKKYYKAIHEWVKSKDIIMRQFFLTLREGVMWIEADVQIVFKSHAIKYFSIHITSLLENAEINTQLQQILI